MRIRLLPIIQAVFTLISTSATLLARPTMTEPGVGRVSESPPQVVEEEASTVPDSEAAAHTEETDELPKSTESEPSRLRVTPQVARMAVAAALRVVGAENRVGMIASMTTRARWSGLIPSLSFHLARREVDQQRLDSGERGEKYGASRGDSTWVEGRLTWKFDRLVFADEESSFSHLRFQAVEERARISFRVLDALAAWERARYNEGASKPNSSLHFDSMLRRAAAEAILDVLTSGWFSAWARGSPQRMAAEPSLSPALDRSSGGH